MVLLNKTTLQTYKNKSALTCLKQPTLTDATSEEIEETRKQIFQFARDPPPFETPSEKAKSFMDAANKWSQENQEDK